MLTLLVSFGRHFVFESTWNYTIDFALITTPLPPQATWKQSPQLPWRVCWCLLPSYVVKFQKAPEKSWKKDNFLILSPHWLAFCMYSYSLPYSPKRECTWNIESLPLESEPFATSTENYAILRLTCQQTLSRLLDFLAMFFSEDLDLWHLEAFRNFRTRTKYDEETACFF